MCASSSLGRMFGRLMRNEGVEVLSVVRRQENIQRLKEEGTAKYLYNLSDTKCLDQLKEDI